MPARNRKAYQNSTVRLPRRVYDLAKAAIQNSDTASSFNDFVIQAIEQKLLQLREAEIDAAFGHMAEDPDYQRHSAAMAREFEKSDWEALRVGENDYEQHSGSKKRAAETRSRRRVQRTARPH